LDRLAETCIRIRIDIDGPSYRQHMAGNRARKQDSTTAAK